MTIRSLRVRRSLAGKGLEFARCERPHAVAQVACLWRRPYSAMRRHFMLPMSSTPANPLLGTWHLCRWEIAYGDGRAATLSYGADALGLILYTADGWMNACIARSQRPRLSGDSMRKLPTAEALAAFERLFQLCRALRAAHAGGPAASGAPGDDVAEPELRRQRAGARHAFRCRRPPHAVGLGHRAGQRRGAAPPADLGAALIPGGRHARAGERAGPAPSAHAAAMNGVWSLPDARADHLRARADMVHAGRPDVGVGHQLAQLFAFASALRSRVWTDVPRRRRRWSLAGATLLAVATRARPDRWPYAPRVRGRTGIVVATFFYLARTGTSPENILRAAKRSFRRLRSAFGAGLHDAAVVGC